MARCIFFFFFLLGAAGCFAQTTLSRRQAIEDIDVYIRTMKESHYDPFRYISAKDYNKHIAEIKNTIGDSISTRDFIFLFYQVTALLHDAHSTPQLGQPIFQEEYKKEQFFPYRLVQEKDKLYIPLQAATELGIPTGAEILDINGENLSALFKQVKIRVGGTPSFSEEAACKLLCYFLFLKNIHPPFVLRYSDKNGRYQKAVVQTGVSFKKALSATLPHLVKPYDSRIIQDKLGYLDVRSLSGDTGHFRAFLDTSFLRFKRAGIRHLAIDLRQNSGGNTALGDLLFSYITTKKYSWGTKSWRISQVYKNYLLAGGDTSALYVKQPNGTVWMSGGSCVPRENPFKTTMLFNGDVFFLTGPFTFSSAMAVADVVKEYKIGTIAGEPTGEYVKDFGEAFVIDLPNSKIKIQSTSSFSHGVSCSREQNGPVLPDIAVHNTLQEEVLGKDKALEYLLNRIP